MNLMNIERINMSSIQMRFDVLRMEVGIEPMSRFFESMMLNGGDFDTWYEEYAKQKIHQYNNILIPKKLPRFTLEELKNYYFRFRNKKKE